MAEEKTCILICGMHRSGTSALAGCLELLGYNLGKTVMPATPDNPKGYFENIKCWQLNEKLLSILDARWDSTSKLETTNIYIQDKLYIHEVHKIIAEDFLNAPDIVIKDPRLSYLLPYWTESLSLLDYTVKIIIPIRQPAAVVRSLFVRDGFSAEKSSLVYANHLLKAISESNNNECELIEYETFIEHPKQSIQRLINNLNLQTPIEYEKINDAITSFVNPPKKNDEVLAIEYLLPKYIIDLYSDIRQAALDKKTKNLGSVIEPYKSLFSNIEQNKTYFDEKYDLLEINSENQDYQVDFLNDLFFQLRENQKSSLAELNNSILSSNSILQNILNKKIDDLQQELSIKQTYQIEKEELRKTKSIEISNLNKELIRAQKSIHNSNQALIQSNIKYDNLKNSLSNKIGFALTWPMRKGYELIKSLRQFVITFFAITGLLIKDPKTARTFISPTNFKKLFASMRAEPHAQLSQNIKNALNQKAGVIQVSENISHKPGETTIISYIDNSIRSSSYILIRGWALSNVQINKIELIDGQNVYPVVYGLDRADLYDHFPTYHNSSKGGFFLFAKINHTIDNATLRIQDAGDDILELNFDFDIIENIHEAVKVADLSGLNTEQQYPIWSMLQDNLSDQQVELKNTPKITIVIPTYNSKKEWLDECIKSIINQSYYNWQLCIYDDASSDQDSIASIKYWEGKDSRIQISYGIKNLHISGANNKALEHTEGEFVGFLDHDDKLHTHALYQIVKLINEEPVADVIYTDEDKIDTTGRHVEPHFKPGWSPETLENVMYLNHFLIVRKSILDQVGGFREAFEGSQDFDLVLRISKITQNIYHVPKVLYHWRMSEGSTAGNLNNKDYVFNAAQKALTSYLDDTERDISITQSIYDGIYTLKQNPSGGRVSIIMAFHNKAQMTIDCLKSIEKSTYQDYEIILISNNSSIEEYSLVFTYVLGHSGTITLYQYDIPFNYSAINNWAIDKTQGEYLLFLNNDMKVISEDWIERLLEHAERPEIGAVGAKLLYEDDTIQHAGVVMRIGGVAGHAFKYLPDNEPGYCGYAVMIRNCSAVTGACLMVSKKAFQEVGGFNEQHLQVAFNDVDLCLKLLKKNYRNIYTPYAKLYHFESKTRPKTIFDMSERELAQFNRESDYMKNTYPNIFEYGDPYYNPNLSLKKENYTLNI